MTLHLLLQLPAHPNQNKTDTAGFAVPDRCLILLLLYRALYCLYYLEQFRGRKRVCFRSETDCYAGVLADALMVYVASYGSGSEHASGSDKAVALAVYGQRGIRRHRAVLVKPVPLAVILQPACLHRAARLQVHIFTRRIYTKELCSLIRASEGSSFAQNSELISDSKHKEQNRKPVRSHVGFCWIVIQ